jgi:fibronectin type 3 domain-containing protein
MRRKPALVITVVLAFILYFASASDVKAQETYKNQTSEIGSGPSGILFLQAEPGNSPGQVVLRWKHYFSDVQNYHILYGTEPGKFQYGALNIGKETSYTVNFLSPGQKYYFAISPVRAGKAQFVSFQVGSLPAPGLVTLPSQAQKPPGPTPSTSLSTIPSDDVFSNQPKDSIRSKGVGRHQLSAEKGEKPGEVKLTWNHAFNNVDNYNIVYGIEPGKFQYGALNIGKTTSFTVRNLTPGQNYFFALVPTKGGKAQYITAQATQESTPGRVEAPSVPTAAAPTGPLPVLTGQNAQDSAINQPKDAIKSKGVGLHQLSVKPGSNKGEVVLEWKPAFGNVTNYDIVYGTEPGKFQYGALNVGNTTSYTVKALKPGEKYYFALVPVKDGKAQYITAQVSGEAPPEEKLTSQEAGQQAAPSSGQPGGSSGQGTGAQPGATVPAQTGGSGGSQQSTTKKDDSSKPSESKKQEKSKKKSVKGAKSFQGGLLDWFLKFFTK